MRIRLLLIVLVAAALASGCGVLGEEGGVELRTDRQRYQLPADTARLTLENGTDETVNGHLCFARLHRELVGGAWKAVKLPRACTLQEVVPLEPGQTTSIALALPDTLRADTYRYHYEYAPGELVRSNRFTITRAR